MAGGGLRQLFLTPKRRPGSKRGLPPLVHGKRRGKLLLLVLIGLAQSGLSILLALSIKHAFDQLMGARHDNSGGFITAGVAIAALVMGAILRWREFLEAERLAQSYIHAVRVSIFRHAMRLGEAGMAQTSRSAVLLRFTGDMSPLRNWVGRGLSGALVAITSIVVTLVALLIVDPFIGAVIAISVLLTGVAAAALAPALDKANRRVRSRRTRLLKHAQDRLTHLPVVETVGDTQRERRLLAKLSNRLAGMSVKRASIVGVLRAIGEGGGAATSLGAFLIGAVLAEYSLATPGAVVAAMMLSGLLSPKVQDVTRAFEYWMGARVSIEKQQRFLALQPLGRRKGSSERSTRLRQAAGLLDLQAAGYREQAPLVSLSLAPGDRAWLHRDSHAEILNILRLAAGVLQPTRGQVMLDGVRLRDLHRRDAQRHITLVSGAFELFEASLRDNLTYGLSSKRAARLDEFVDRHGLRELVDESPGGMDYRVRSGDRRITGARRLLFGLIRARLAGARVILVDQADIALGDTESAAIARLLADFDGAVLWASRQKAPQPGFHAVEVAEADAAS